MPGLPIYIISWAHGREHAKMKELKISLQAIREPSWSIYEDEGGLPKTNLVTRGPVKSRTMKCHRCANHL